MLAFVVEDDPDLSTIFSEALESCRHNIEKFWNGETAMARLGQLPKPDIIVLDYHLPAMSGQEILTYIRGEPRLSGMLVIMCTADVGMINELAQQADMVMLKPVSFKQLRDAIKCLAIPGGKNERISISDRG